MLSDSDGTLPMLPMYGVEGGVQSPSICSEILCRNVLIVDGVFYTTEMVHESSTVIFILKIIIITSHKLLICYLVLYTVVS